MQLHSHDSSRGAPVFDETQALSHVSHYLPAQAPLNDFIHHNTLHAFQDLPFDSAVNQAHVIFGHQVYASIDFYRKRYEEGGIVPSALEQAIAQLHGEHEMEQWLFSCLHERLASPHAPRIGQLRALWKSVHHIDLDARVHPLLFRNLGTYLDQGIATAPHPYRHLPFRQAMSQLNVLSHVPIFRSKRVNRLLRNPSTQLKELLEILVGDDKWFEQYLFDLCFAHAGWSGMVAAIEAKPESLIDRRQMTLHDAVFVELLMEIDALDQLFGTIWAPLAAHPIHVTNLFDAVTISKTQKVQQIWQCALEWNFYNPLLTAVQGTSLIQAQPISRAQVILCIDDRECSFRRYLESGDQPFTTFGTPGFFGAAFYFKPFHGVHTTKLCPAPLYPKYLIKETNSRHIHQKEHSFSSTAFHPMAGWLMSPLLGLVSLYHLIRQLIAPSVTSKATFAQHHSHPSSKLHIAYDPTDPEEDGLQLGFRTEEMVEIVCQVLRSIGLTKHFDEIVYVMGHGSSSTNNPHYAAYDCGACSGRAGSVNARVFAHMANDVQVRKALFERGIEIPDSTRFIGCLHDTSRDEVLYYDLDDDVPASHHDCDIHIQEALQNNAKERARRFESVQLKQSPAALHRAMKRRSVSLFEPRPELNHATNAACIVGRRSLSQSVFMDRRSFLNSYDHSLDPNGDLLYGILRAVAPVCGGINLEYYFSRMDNRKLGAGSKLPHNVVGLIGVSNGIEGDLRPGLPSQMTELHDPLRLLVIVEQLPELILQVIQRDVATYNWFQNQWIHLVSISPNDHSIMYFNGQTFLPHTISPCQAADEFSHEGVLRQRNNLPIQTLRKK
jgi:uncharacterized protein